MQAAITLTKGVTMKRVNVAKPKRQAGTARRIRPAQVTDQFLIDLIRIQMEWEAISARLRECFDEERPAMDCYTFIPVLTLIGVSEDCTCAGTCKDPSHGDWAFEASKYMHAEEGDTDLEKAAADSLVTARTMIKRFHLEGMQDKGPGAHIKDCVFDELFTAGLSFRRFVNTMERSGFSYSGPRLDEQCFRAAWFLMGFDISNEQELSALCSILPEPDGNGGLYGQAKDVAAKYKQLLNN